MVRTFRGCSARGKAEQLVLFCSDFCWIFDQIGLFFDLAFNWIIFGLELAIL